MKLKHIILVVALTVCISAYSQTEQSADSVAIAETIEVISEEISGDVTLTEDNVPEVIVVEAPDSADVMDVKIVYDYKQSPQWVKYKTLRTVGWSMAGASVGLFLGGFAVALCCFANDFSDDGVAVAGAWLIVSAPVVLVASIPILAVAYRNRYKAKHLKLEAGVDMIRTQSPMLAMRPTPAAGLTLRF